MISRTYGVSQQGTGLTQVEQHLEELAIIGYSVVQNVLVGNELETARLKLDEVYQQQAENQGRDYLSRINELNLARCPLAYDEFFLGLSSRGIILEIAQAAIGGGYILLHLQNGIINTPHEEHHQSAWHRDLPYQEFTISKPLAVSALYCLDDFT